MGPPWSGPESFKASAARARLFRWPELDPEDVHVRAHGVGMGGWPEPEPIYNVFF